jgi:hypothetical protein
VFIAPVHQHPEHDKVRIDLDTDQVRGAQRDHGHRVRIHWVGLSAVAGSEHSHLRRQLRRHVHHRFAVVDQPVCDVLADAVAAFYRPYALGVPAAGFQHLVIAGLVGAVPACPARKLRFVR